MTASARAGVLGVLLACLIWGLAPLYYRYLSRVASAEMLAHRMLWSALTFGALLALRGRLGALTRMLRGPEGGRVVTAAIIIAFNWGLFIWAIQNGHAVEAGLGYYIFPLVAIVIGVATLGERLSPLQGVAVALAGLAAVVLTLGLGVAPWIALALAASFAGYVRIKKGIIGDPMVSVTLEVVILLPFALGWLLWLGLGEGSGAFGRDLEASLLLPFSGFLTAFPLLLFSRGAQAVRLSTLGLVQYLNPTLQVAAAALVMGDAFTRWHGLALGLIWAALALYSAESWRAERRAASASSSAVTEVTRAK